MVSGELPRVLGRCHTRWGALASNPQRLRPSSLVPRWGGKAILRRSSSQRPFHANATTGHTVCPPLPAPPRRPALPSPGRQRRHPRDTARLAPSLTHPPLRGPPRWGRENHLRPDRAPRTARCARDTHPLHTHTGPPGELLRPPQTAAGAAPPPTQSGEKTPPPPRHRPRRAKRTGGSGTRLQPFRKRRAG